MNRCIRVLQTHALPLGYCAMIKKYGIDLSKFWYITEWCSSGVADPRLTTWLLRLIYRRYISSLLMYLLNYTRIRRFRQLFFFIKRYGSHSAQEPETVF